MVHFSMDDMKAVFLAVKAYILSLHDETNRSFQAVNADLSRKANILDVYNRNETDQLLESVGKYGYTVIDALPDASSETSSLTYLVPTDAENVYEQFVTVLINGEYSWRSLGTTSIDLVDYAKKEDTVYLTQEQYDELERMGQLKPFVEYNIFEE